MTNRVTIGDSCQTYELLWTQCHDDGPTILTYNFRSIKNKASMQRQAHSFGFFHQQWHSFHMYSMYVLFQRQTGPNNVNVVKGEKASFTWTRIRYVPGAIRPSYTSRPKIGLYRFPKRKYGAFSSTRCCTRARF